MIFLFGKISYNRKTNLLQFIVKNDIFNINNKKGEKMKIEELSIQEKIGQMIIIGMDTNYITDRIKTMITKYKICGIILYRKNFTTYEEMIKLIQQLKVLNKEIEEIRKECNI